MSFLLMAAAAGAVVLVAFVMFLASRYRRCPSDRVLVIFGSVGADRTARCIHGGGALVWPVIQESAFLSLTPMTMVIPLQNALSQQNIRIHVPSTFTVGISTDPPVMQNAAERLLGLQPRQIEEMAQEIIFGQLRLTVASLTIEEINQDREKFLSEIRRNVEPELNKIGLNLINVNVTDIRDESDYIESIGKKAAAEAINRAMVEVAEQEKLGAIGQAAANRQKEIEVTQNEAEAAKGKKKTEAERRIYLQQQETEAALGEAKANRDKTIGTAEFDAESLKGRKSAEADQRVFIQKREAEAIAGENESRAAIAASNAQLAAREAEANQTSEVARRQAEAAIQKAQYEAELARLTAEQVVSQEVERKKIEIEAAARAEQARLAAKGDADATLMRYEAEAQGVRQVLDAKAQGYESLVRSCEGDARAAATLLMIEKLEGIVDRQVEAISNLKIDKITVWDGGQNNGNGNATSNFLSGMVKALPPLHEVAGMAGLELPDYLGRLGETASEMQAKGPDGAQPDRTTPPPVPPYPPARD